MVSMLVTTIGRVVVNNLLELIGLVPFIVGCRKLSGSDTLILVTLTCVNRAAVLSLSMIKNYHSILQVQVTVTPSLNPGVRFVEKRFLPRFVLFLNVSSSPSVAPLRLPECSAARLVTELQVGEFSGRRVPPTPPTEAAFLPEIETRG